jgi:hypothetical protein
VNENYKLYFLKSDCAHKHRLIKMLLSLKILNFILLEFHNATFVVKLKVEFYYNKNLNSLVNNLMH